MRLNLVAVAAIVFAIFFSAGCGHETESTTSQAQTPPSTNVTASPSAPLPVTSVPSSSPQAAVPSSEAPASAVAVGGPAPDFEVRASDGTSVHLAALKGKPVVVYFYPKDETPGCTKEACSFRDAWDRLSKTGVVLIGISGDTDDSHKGFASHYKLPFLLVSDPAGKIAAQYGVPFSNGYASRQSFVVGADGNVKKIYRKVDVTVHAGQIASDLGL